MECNTPRVKIDFTITEPYGSTTSICKDVEYSSLKIY